MKIGPYGRRAGEFRVAPDDVVPRKGRAARSPIERKHGRRSRGKWYWFGWPGAVLGLVVGAAVGGLLLWVGLWGLDRA